MNARVQCGTSFQCVHLYSMYMYLMLSTLNMELLCKMMCIICLYFSLFIKKHKMIYLNSDSIHSIRRGMEFGYMLELPRSVAFAGECMAELLAAEGTVRSFRQIRYIVFICTCICTCIYIYTQCT